MTNQILTYSITITKKDYKQIQAELAQYFKVRADFRLQRLLEDRSFRSQLPNYIAINIILLLIVLVLFHPSWSGLLIYLMYIFIGSTLAYFVMLKTTFGKNSDKKTQTRINKRTVKRLTQTYQRLLLRLKKNLPIRHDVSVYPDSIAVKLTEKPRKYQFKNIKYIYIAQGFVIFTYGKVLNTVQIFKLPMDSETRTGLIEKLKATNQVMY